MLLQHVTTAAQYPATGTDRCLPVTGRCVGPQPAWLLQDCAGWASCQLDLASVQNAAARLIFGLRRSEHNGPASQSSLVSRPREHPLQSRRIYLPNRELQCSCVPAILLYPSCWRAIAIETPIYHPSPTNWLFHLTTSLVSAEGPFQFWLPFSGTVTLHISHQHRRSRFSGSVLRLFSSGAPMLT